MKTLITQIALLFIIFSTSSFSQREASHLVLGKYMVLKFSGDDFKHELLDTSTFKHLYPYEDPNNIAYKNLNFHIISDKNGEIKLYNNNNHLWNGNHELFDSVSYDIDFPLFVPHPYDTNMYYLFYASYIKSDTIFYNLYYSLIDLSGNNSKGIIIEKDILLEKDVAFPITAVRHRNGIDIWLICHSWEGNTFYVYLISKNGLTKVSEQNVGRSIFYKPEDKWAKRYTWHDLKFSPCGKYIGFSIDFEWFFILPYLLNYLEIFQFDNLTGEINSFLILDNYTISELNFTSNGKYLYFTDHVFPVVGSVGGANLNRIDFTKNNHPIDIIDIGYNRYPGPINLALNENLYYDIVCHQGTMDTINKYQKSSAIYVIINPAHKNPNDIKIKKCVFEFTRYLYYNNFYQANRLLSYHYFNTFGIYYIQSYFYVKEIDACGGYYTNFRIADPDNPEAERFEWRLTKLERDYGNTFEEVNKYLNQLNERGDSIFYVYPYMTGDYWVTITNYSGMSYNQRVRLRLYTQPRASIAVKRGRTPCDPVTLTAKPDSSDWRYHWSTGDTGKTTTAYTSGRYFLVVENLGGCIDTVYYDIVIPDPPTASIHGDSILCPGARGVLRVLPDSAGYTYRWSTGETTPTIEVSKEGLYTVIVTNEQGCSYTVSIKVVVNPELQVAILGMRELCERESTMLRASLNGDEYIYKWSNGAETPEIEISEAGIYWLYVANDLGCSGSDTVEVIVNPLPKVSIIADKKVLCPGESSVLRCVAQPGVTYTWSSGEIGDTIAIARAGIYSIIAESGKGCRAYDTIEIRQADEIEFEIEAPAYICSGSQAEISVSKDFPGYLWSTGETTRSINIANGGEYGVIVTDEWGCSAEQSVTIEEITLDLSYIDLTQDFGKQLITTSETWRGTLINREKHPITVAELTIGNPSVFSIETSPKLPTILDVNEILNINIYFRPNELKLFKETLTVTVSEPCTAVLAFNISGAGYAVAKLSLPEMESEIGVKDYCVPLNAEMYAPRDTALSLDYEAELEHNAMFYYVQSVRTSNLQSNTIQAGVQKVAIDGTELITPQRKAIAELCGDLLLTNENKIPLVIARAESRNPLFELITEDGTLEVAPICVQDFRSLKLLEVPQITLQPNPASEYIEINLCRWTPPSRWRPSGSDIKLYNTLGKCVINYELRITNYDKPISIDISHLPAGIYYLRIGEIGRMFVKM